MTKGSTHAWSSLLKKSTQCPACKSKELKDIGSIHRVESLFSLDDTGHLYHCLHCNLFFRHPYLNEVELARAYASIGVDTWVYTDREDMRLARKAISSACTSGSVLDVGCFRGDFLRSLPKSYHYYGIEPSSGARSFAQDNGITIVSENIQSWDENQRTFDVITLLDVIEHLPNPVQALEKLSRALKPGGIIVISTGNTNALPWRMMRLNYWYYFSEHVSFFNPKWFSWVAKKLQMRVESVQSFSHFEDSFFIRWKQLFEALSYQVVNAMSAQSLAYRLLTQVYPFSRAATWEKPPKTHAWRDHMLVVIRKF